MKLLLTSGGITNKSIAAALFDLVAKRPEETSVVFVPTAANVVEGDKSWFINDLANLKKQNFKSIEIADISAVPETIWRPKFEEADVLFLEGGDACHLMKWINKSGLFAILPGLLKSKIYVGVSAGSMVTNKRLDIRILQTIYEENMDAIKNMVGLNLVDFFFLPHLNDPDFRYLKENFIREAVKDFPEKTFALDDNSALKVIDGKVEVVSGGKWFIING
jgi:dipeptidase E